MKTVLLLVLSLYSLSAFSQKAIYYDSLYYWSSAPNTYINKPLVLDFNDSASLEYIFIDSTQANNVWVFDSINKPGFLVSDSVFLTTGKSNNYDTSLFSSFILKLKIGQDQTSKWFSSFGLGFIHKYDTDSATDGLIIETSSDGGQTWFNALDLINTPFIGLNLRTWDSTINWSYYTYIPNTNIQINTGKSDSLIYSRLAWGVMMCKTTYDSLLVRVSFRSDDFNTFKSGWAIQKIIVEGNHFESGGFNEKNISNYYQVYSYDKTIIINTLKPISNTNQISIYNILGEKVFTETLMNNQSKKIDLPNAKTGIYFIEIKNEKGKFIEKVWLQ